MPLPDILDEDYVPSQSIERLIAARKVLVPAIMAAIGEHLDCLCVDELRALEWDLTTDRSEVPERLLDEFGDDPNSPDYCWEALLAKLGEIMADPEYGNAKEVRRDYAKWGKLVKTKIGPALQASCQRRFRRLQRAKT